MQENNRQDEVQLSNPQENQNRRDEQYNRRKFNMVNTNIEKIEDLETLEKDVCNIFFKQAL